MGGDVIHRNGRSKGSKFPDQISTEKSTKDDRLKTFLKSAKKGRSHVWTKIEILWQSCKKAKDEP
jgi:hypothetical protein